MTGIRIVVSAFVLAISLTLASPALAANQVTEITVDVTLESDGSAYVVETWDGIFDEGTECYFPIHNLEGITLSDLQVSDQSGTYTTLEQWSTDASFDEKAHMCGLNPVEDGYEVCWGISTYGENRYCVEYRLDGLAAAYEDYDGFLFQFIPSEMNTGPTDALVHIRTRDGISLTEENTSIWAFGFEGQIGFSQDGEILAYTQQPLTDSNNVTIMLQLNKGIVAPSRVVSDSFEAVKTPAFEGSDYSPEDDGGFWLIVILAIAAVVGTLIWIGGAEQRHVKALSKHADYYREAPIGGNLEASFVLARQFFQSDDDGDLIAATLIRLLAMGCLEPLSQPDAGRTDYKDKSVSLRLIKAPAGGSLTARMLYGLLEKAAGSDGILQEKELQHYCEINYHAMLSIVTEANRDGRDTLVSIGCYNSGGDTSHLKALSSRGQKLLLQIIGYKKFLLDFSLIAERSAGEAIIWQDCLTFAALLGIAAQVMRELHKLYPNVADSLQNAATTYYVACQYQRATYLAAKRSENAANRSSSGGGNSSLGGGGGFSGGGSGGGTR